MNPLPLKEWEAKDHIGKPLVALRAERWVRIIRELENAVGDAMEKGEEDREANIVDDLWRLKSELGISNR